VGGHGWAHIEVWRLPRSAQVDIWQFNLGRMVGRAICGTIYEATDKKTGKRVAAKQLVDLSDPPTEVHLCTSSWFGRR
jgi:hypothetical protein